MGFLYRNIGIFFSYIGNIGNIGNIGELGTLNVSKFIYTASNDRDIYLDASAILFGVLLDKVSLVV